MEINQDILILAGLVAIYWVVWTSLMQHYAKKQSGLPEEIKPIGPGERSA